MGFLTRFLGRIHAPWWALALAASLVTMALAGTVVIVATPAGCRAAQSLHVSNASCGGSGNTPVAQLGGTPSPLTTASPLPGSSPSAPQSPFQEPSPSPIPPPTPLVPYSYPPSSALPPYGIVGSTPLPADVSPSCRLPISQGQSGSGGFIVLPGGSYVADPRSTVSVPATAPQPPLGGTIGQLGSGIAYDSVHGRWLPVSYNEVTPDGSRYAYAAVQGGVVVVNAADNTFSVLGAGRAWQILSLDDQGVYATVQQTAGLWLLPFVGGTQQITATGFWQGVAAGAAYGTAASAVPQGVANPFIRLDLKTGTIQTWFTVDGASYMQLVGFDGNGSPLILVNVTPSFTHNETYLWSVPSLGGGITIAVVLGPGFYQPPSFGGNFPPVADAHGLWFGSGEGIFLFIPYKAWYLASTFNGLPAGACA